MTRPRSDCSATVGSHSRRLVPGEGCRRRDRRRRPRFGSEWPCTPSHLGCPLGMLPLAVRGGHFLNQTLVDGERPKGTGCNQLTEAQHVRKGVQEANVSHNLRVLVTVTAVPCGRVIECLLFGTAVLMVPVRLGRVGEGLPGAEDDWDGSPACRRSDVSGKDHSDMNHGYLHRDLVRSWMDGGWTSSTKIASSSNAFRTRLRAPPALRSPCRCSLSEVMLVVMRQVTMPDGPRWDLFGRRGNPESARSRPSTPRCFAQSSAPRVEQVRLSALRARVIHSSSHSTLAALRLPVSIFGGEDVLSSVITTWRSANAILRSLP